MSFQVDISDELRDVIQLLEGYDDKIRVVMTKADSLDPADLLKVNSALTWSLARILKAPEVRRTYVGSFWDQPLQPNYMNELFEKEAQALMAFQGQDQIEQQGHRYDTVGRPDEGGIATHIKKFGDAHSDARAVTHRVRLSRSRISDRVPASRAVAK